MLAPAARTGAARLVAATVKRLSLSKASLSLALAACRRGRAGYSQAAIMEGDRLIAVNGRDCVHARMRVVDAMLLGPLNSVSTPFARAQCAAGAAVRCWRAVLACSAGVRCWRAVLACSAGVQCWCSCHSPGTQSVLGTDTRTCLSQSGACRKVRSVLRLKHVLRQHVLRRHVAGGPGGRLCGRDRLTPAP